MPRFLFEARLTDGTLIQQNPDDISHTDPTKNCFYDVLQRIGEVEVFGLFSDDVPWTYAVDLRTGEFSVSGIPFTAQNPTNMPPDGTQFRLIWFRRHTHTLTPDGGETHVIDAHIGWQATVDGKNLQQTIAVRTDG